MLPYSRKDPLPFPFFEAVTALRFSPDYLTRERQEFKEEGKPQVVLPFCPRGGRRESPRSAERNSPLDFKRKTSRPLGANTLTQFEYPAQPVLKKLPPGQGEPPARFRCPNRPVQKKGDARTG